MAARRTFYEHLPLYDAYAARVAQLPPESWDRLRLRCADLNGPAFRALLNRAFVAAKPHEMWLPHDFPPPRSLRVIAGVSRIVQTSISFIAEVAAEFEASKPGVHGPVRTRRQSSGNAQFDAYIDAYFRIESALGPLQHADPGVVTAVRAAGQAVLRHDWLAPADFEAVYARVEPEIPFADLDPPATGTTT